MLFDIIAASLNEGISWDIVRRYMPKAASQELDITCHKFGESLYREILWDEREKESKGPPCRSSIAWPVKRASAKIVSIRSRK